MIHRRLWRALTANEAATGPRAKDPRLRGRTYAIPFDAVWNASLALAGGELPRWNLVEADDREGIIRAEARTLIFRFVDDVRIRISLDENGQTRVDAESRSRVGKADLGVNARRIRRFLKKLDRALEATNAQILVR